MKCLDLVGITISIRMNKLHGWEITFVGVERQPGVFIFFGYVRGMNEAVW